MIMVALRKTFPYESSATTFESDPPTGEYLLAAEVVVDGVMSRQHSLGRTALAGISGIDGVGKTRFSDTVQRLLLSRDVPTTVVHVDNFTHPRNRRHSSPDGVNNYYNHTFDLESLARYVLGPVRGGEAVDIDLTHPSPQDDDVAESHGYRISPQNGVVLVEGVFLFRPELVDYFDYRALLTMPIGQMLERLCDRDVQVPVSNILDKVVEKYAPAQQAYLDAVHPERLVDVVFDFTDLEHPMQIIDIQDGGNDD